MPAAALTVSRERRVATEVQDRLAPVSVLHAWLSTMNSSTDNAESTMSSTGRPNRINVDLQGFKQPWLDSAWGAALPREQVRHVVAKLTSIQFDGETVGEVPRDACPAVNSLAVS